MKDAALCFWLTEQLTLPSDHQPRASELAQQAGVKMSSREWEINPPQPNVH